MNRQLYLLIVLATMAVAGCGGISEPESTWPSDNSTPSSTTGLYFIKAQGENPAFAGLPGEYLGYPDDKALAKKPGYGIYGGHIGGYGDTLEIISSQNGIFMSWAYGFLKYICLYGNWKGELYTSKNTSTGIHLGSTGDEFKKKFPDAEVQEPNRYGGKSYRISIPETLTSGYSKLVLVVACDNNGVIKMMSVIDFLDVDFKGYSDPTKWSTF